MKITNEMKRWFSKLNFKIDSEVCSIVRKCVQTYEQKQFNVLEDFIGSSLLDLRGGMFPALELIQARITMFFLLIQVSCLVSFRKENLNNFFLLNVVKCRNFSNVVIDHGIILE